MRALKISLVAILFSFSHGFSGDGFISICSFNIAELGGSRPNKNHQAIASMIQDFDLVVVQEV